MRSMPNSVSRSCAISVAERGPRLSREDDLCARGRGRGGARQHPGVRGRGSREHAHLPHT